MIRTSALARSAYELLMAKLKSDMELGFTSTQENLEHFFQQYAVGFDKRLASEVLTLIPSYIHLGRRRVVLCLL